MDAEILLLYFAAVEQIQRCKFLLKVNQWSQAYEVIMEHIATDCVQRQLPLFGIATERVQISKKFIKGQILSDYRAECEVWSDPGCYRRRCDRGISFDILRLGFAY
ncbi:uncharacterized protein LOC129763486 [Toxorhynchites rutilus septentrionalis]|uniref:uncharacterized protein LOC129763486 n=1 Tax=Toxorhynchites rutilus septentrionalis TaxID=329112 RepID=UPI00247AF64D|nr:uncharacterized protein LOC129763486 [Toxorhynchites rutilus septentrionalis]